MVIISSIPCLRFVFYDGDLEIDIYFPYTISYGNLTRINFGAYDSFLKLKFILFSGFWHYIYLFIHAILVAMITL